MVVLSVKIMHQAISSTLFQIPTYIFRILLNCAKPRTTMNPIIIVLSNLVSPIREVGLKNLDRGTSEFPRTQLFLFKASQTLFTFINISPPLCPYEIASNLFILYFLILHVLAARSSKFHYVLQYHLNLFYSLSIIPRIP